MANIDGDITLRVNTTPGEIDSTANEIKSKIEDIFSKSHGKELSNDFIKAQEEASKLYNKITTLQDQIKEAPAKAPETAAFKAASVAAEQYKAEIDSLEEEIKNLAKTAGVDLQKLPEILAGFRASLESGTKMPAKLIALQPIADLEQKLNDVRQKFDEAEAAKQNLLDSNQAYDFSNYNSLVNDLNNANNSAARIIGNLRQVSGMRPETTKWEAFKNVLGGIKTLTAGNIKTFGSFVKTLASKAISGASNALKGLGSALSGLNRHTRSSNGILEIGFKKLVQYGFGIRTVFLLVKKLRQALIDGFSSMAQYSGEFNNVVSQFVSALATLKLSFATAFAPIASVAIPLLTGLMNALIDAMNLIGKFFAALTGKSNFIQAKRVQKDYAASLNDTGKSGGNAAKGIKKAEKAAKEAQKTIAGFDDVEILHNNSDTSPSAGSGGSGGGGGGGIGDLSGADMFETVPIESKIRDFANKIRDLIGAQDWTGLGTFLGECINSIFATAKDLISWDNLGSRIEFAVNAITTTFNSLVTTIDWDLIGSTFAEGINTIVKTLFLLMYGIDWGTLGAGIGTGIDSLFRDIDWKQIGSLVGVNINAIIDTIYGLLGSIDFSRIGKDLMNGFNRAIGVIKWSKLGSTLAKGVNSVVDFIFSAIKTFDWKKASTSLASAVNNFIKNIDWNKIGHTLSEFAKTAFNFIHNAVREVDWVAVVTSFFDLLLGVDWLGLLATALGGQAGTIAAVGSKLVGALGEAVRDAFTSFTSYFQTEIDEAGGNIVEGIYNGITKAISNIGTWIVDNIFTPFIDNFKTAFGIASPSKVMEEQGGFIIEGLLNGITNAWTSIKTFFSEGVTGIIDKIKKGKWSSAGEESINQTKKGITKKWSEVPKFFTTGVNDVISKFKNSDWKGTGETSVDKTKSGISNKWSGISNYFATGTSNIISKFKNSEWKGTGETSVNKTKEGVSNKWSVLSKYFDTNVTAINTAIKNVKWGDAGKAIVTTLKAGIANTWSVISAYIKDKTTTISNYIKHFDWASAGRKIVSELKSGLSSTWGTVNDFISSKIGSIKDKFYSTNWSGIGEDICSGISRGMSNGWSWVTSKAKDLAEAAYDAARNKLDIHSPSKLFRDGIGKMIPEGLALGISQNEDLALNAMKRLTSSIGSTEMPKLEIPSIAMGKIIPYQAGKTTNSDNTTLAEVANLLKYNQQHSVSKDDLAETLRAVLPSMLREYMSFYIGDEQIARHANAGNVSLNRRFSTTG